MYNMHTIIWMLHQDSVVFVIEIWLAHYWSFVQYASGQISYIRVWDLDREQLLSHIPSHPESSVSALVSFNFQGSLRKWEIVCLPSNVLESVIMWKKFVRGGWIHLKHVSSVYVVLLVQQLSPSGFERALVAPLTLNRPQVFVHQNIRMASFWSIKGLVGICSKVIFENKILFLWNWFT